MPDTYRPETEDRLRDLIAWAAAEEEPIEVVGAGTKRGLGRPMQTTRSIDLSGLTGIVHYEPEELVLSARAGTSLSEIEAALAEHRQALAFEPPDFGPLWGRAAGEQTIGGVLASNLGGSRRVKAGAARDHFLGFRGVTGRGETITIGGRVVKNVTGYDLCKLMAGSYGTLAALVEVTIKVLPRGDKVRTILVYGLDGAEATRAMTEALGSSHEVSGAAHLLATLAGRSSVGYVSTPGASVTAIRVEGPARSVEHRGRALAASLAEYGTVDELHSVNSQTFWREVSNVAQFVGDVGDVLWRLSIPPASADRVIEALGRNGLGDAFLDWGGGLVWAPVPPGVEVAAHTIRDVATKEGGHATLWRGPDGMRAAVEVFQPPLPPLAALTRRVKAGFDPHGILNPGRMYAGI